MESLKETTEANYGRKGEKASQNVVVPPEVLFASPIFLKSNKAIQFLEKCHDDTKEDSKMEDFKTRVNENAKKCKIWPKGKTWKDVIDENDESGPEKRHFEILRTFINSDGTSRKKLLDVDPNMVTDLLGVIRNKYSHKRLLGEDVLKTLGWGKGISNEFCGENFLAYWTLRFPKLLPFLWEQYKVPMANVNPGGAYPPLVKSQCSSICLFDKKTRFGEQLSSALSKNLEEGWLEDHFIFGKDGAMTLEFRTLETCYLDVDKFNFLEIEFPGIGNQRIIRRWYEIVNDKITLSEENTISLTCKKEGSGRESFSGRILVCNKLSELINFFSKDQCISIFESNRKLIIFTNKLKQETKMNVVNKFSAALQIEYFNRPVKWSDLEIPTQNTLINQAEIQIQGTCLKFEDFLTDAVNAGTLDEILLNLRGTELNKILKNKTVVVAALDTNIISPTCEQTYISRKVYSRGNVSSKFFQNQPTKSQLLHKFIIVQSGEQKVPNDQNAKFTNIYSLNEFQNIDINDSESTLFYVEEPLQNFANISIRFKCSVEANVNVHIFECLEADRFEWVATMHGSFAEIKKGLYKEAEMGACDQETVLNNIVKSKMQGGIIFISDKPGMGKTELLINLAGKLRLREHTCIILLEMQNIVENTREVSKDQIINTIIDLSCSGNFEKVVMRHLLNSNALGIKFEIMIDGLDEVQSKHTNLAYDVLKVFQREISWVRVWLTGRGYLLEEVRLKLGVLCYKFLPFTRTEQIGYLKRFWRERWNNSGKTRYLPSDRTLEVAAKDLLTEFICESQAHLPGIPLQCKMIAEVFEEKVLNSDFSLDDTAAFGLHTIYDQMLEKKFRIYWAEKQKLSVTAGPDVAETTRKEIYRFLVYSAIKLIFSEEKANELKSYLEIPRRKKDLEKLKMDALKHGIIQSLSPLRFIHRTFAEYIVASFVTQEVEDCLESNELLDSIEEVVKDFILNDVLCLTNIAHSTVSIYSYDFQHKYLINFLRKKLDPVLSNISITFRDGKITPAYYKLMKILKKLMFDNRLFIILRDTSAYSIHTKQHEYAYYCGLKYILAILILLNPLTSFVFALSHELLEVAKFIADEMNFGPEHWHKVREFDESKSGVLHRFVSVLRNWQSSWLFTYAVEQNPSLFEERDSKGRTPFLAAISYVFKITHDDDFKYPKMTWNQMELVKTLERPLSPSIDALFLYHKLTIDKLVELGADINATDNDGNTALHLIFSSRPRHSNVSCVNDLDWYISFADFFLPHNYNWVHLNQFNKAGSTPLLCFLDNFCSTFENNQELASNDTLVLNRVFGELQKYGMNFNARDTETDETILHKAIQGKYPLIFIELMVSHGASVLDKNGKGQCAIHLAEEYQHIPVIRYLNFS